YTVTAVARDGWSAVTDRTASSAPVRGTPPAPATVIVRVAPLPMVVDAICRTGSGLRTCDALVPAAPNHPRSTTVTAAAPPEASTTTRPACDPVPSRTS